MFGSEFQPFWPETAFFCPAGSGSHAWMLMFVEGICSGSPVQSVSNLVSVTWSYRLVEWRLVIRSNILPTRKCNIWPQECSLWHISLKHVLLVKLLINAIVNCLKLIASLLGDFLHYEFVIMQRNVVFCLSRPLHFRSRIRNSAELIIITDIVHSRPLDRQPRSFVLQTSFMFVAKVVDLLQQNEVCIAK